MTDIVVGPADSSIVYSATDAVRKSSDGGHTRKTVFRPAIRSRRGYVQRIAIAPTRPETIYATAMGAHDGSTSVYKSTDAGASWHATGVPGGVFRIQGSWGTAPAVDPLAPTTVYAAIRKYDPQDDRRRRELAADHARPPPPPTRRQRACTRHATVGNGLCRPLPRRHLQDHKRRTHLGSSCVGRFHPRARRRPRTTSNDLRRRQRHNAPGPDAQEHRQRPHLDHRALNQAATRQPPGCVSVQDCPLTVITAGGPLRGTGNARAVAGVMVVWLGQQFLWPLWRRCLSSRRQFMRLRRTTSL